MSSSGELLVEAGCRLARRPARVQIGTGNRYSYPGGQSGSTYVCDCTQASLPSVLDIQKAYDSLGRGKFIELLRGYRMGNNLDRILKSYWDHQRIVPKMGKFLGTYLRTGRGLT